MFSVWFACKTCRGSFSNLDDFVDHKKEHHWEEFQSTKCIIFEERRIQGDEQTVSFSPTVTYSEESGEANPLKYIDLPTPTIKLEVLNDDVYSDPEFPCHQTQNLECVTTEYQTDGDLKDFFSSRNVTGTNLETDFKPPFLNGSNILQNSAINDSWVQDTFPDAKSGSFDFEDSDTKNATPKLNACVNRSHFGSSQNLIQTHPSNPFVLLRRLTSQELQQNSSVPENVNNYIAKAYSGSGSGSGAGVQSESGRFKCQEKNCERSYKHHQSLLVHQRTHSSSDIRPFKCPRIDCGKSFKEKSSLSRHRAVHLESRPLNSFLQHYEKTLKTRSKLRNQRSKVPSNSPPLLHRSTELKPDHSLSACEIETNDKTNNTRTTGTGSQSTQYAVHLDSGTFTCYQLKCGKTFKRHWNLERHRSLAHSEDKPFKCPVLHCTYKCKDKYSLKLHLQLTRHANLIINCTEQMTEFLNPRGDYQLHPQK